MTTSIKLTKESAGQYKYEGEKFNWKIGLIDDGKSFCWDQYDKDGSLIFDDGWYGLRLKDIREVIYQEELVNNPYKLKT